jgi:cytochrome c oxidase assembly factor CtaG
MLAASLVVFAPTVALAHEQVPHHPADLLRTWGAEPGSILALLISAWLYAAGLARTWRASGSGHGIRKWEAGCFAAGWVSLLIALVSPLHPWGQVLFSAHMTQHEILMLIAAPLLVLGRPMIPFLRALPPAWAAALARLSNTGPWRKCWSIISNAFVAWLVHGAVLWVWHLPYLFQLTLRSELAHATQHACFLFSALLFWWAIIHVEDRAIGYGAAVLYMFTTALHSGLLGVLLTFAPHVWYPAYAHSTQSWGLTPLEDQQLGGLIMWIPAGIVYIVAGLALVAGWLRESERRVLKNEAQARARAGAGAGAGAAA